MKRPRSKQSASCPPSKSGFFFGAGYSIKYHSYKIEYRHRSHEIQAPEVWLADSPESPRMLILPEYLLPRRPYPIEVYACAMNEYCGESGMSQREAAETARKRFGLATFAHTTLGRALKKLREVIGGIEKAPCRAGETGGAAPDGGDAAPPGAEGQGGSGLAERREKAGHFLGEWLPRGGAAAGVFEAACRAMAGGIWKRYLKLLI